MGFDLHHLNGKFLPFLEYNRGRNPGLHASDYLELEGLMAILNQGKIFSRSVSICDDRSPAADFRAVLLSEDYLSSRAYRRAV